MSTPSNVLAVRIAIRLGISRLPGVLRSVGLGFLVAASMGLAFVSTFVFIAATVEVISPLGLVRTGFLGIIQVHAVFFLEAEGVMALALAVLGLVVWVKKLPPDARTIPPVALLLSGSVVLSAMLALVLGGLFLVWKGLSVLPGVFRGIGPALAEKRQQLLENHPELLSKEEQGRLGSLIPPAAMENQVPRPRL
jgi:hypothetical protein